MRSPYVLLLAFVACAASAPQVLNDPSAVQGKQDGSVNAAGLNLHVTKPDHHVVQGTVKERGTSRRHRYKCHHPERPSSSPSASSSTSTPSTPSSLPQSTPSPESTPIVTPDPDLEPTPTTSPEPELEPEPETPKPNRCGKNLFKNPGFADDATPLGSPWVVEHGSGEVVADEGHETANYMLFTNIVTNNEYNMISQPVEDLIPWNTYTIGFWWQVKPGSSFTESWGRCDFYAAIGGDPWGEGSRFGSDAHLNGWQYHEYTVSQSFTGTLSMGAVAICYGGPTDVEIMFDDFTVVEHCPDTPTCIKSNLLENPSFESGIGSSERTSWVQTGGYFRGAENGITGYQSPTYFGTTFTPDTWAAPLLTQEVYDIDISKPYIVGFYYAPGDSYPYTEARDSCYVSILIDGGTSANDVGLRSGSKRGEYIYAEREIRWPDWSSGSTHTVAFRVLCSYSPDPVDLILDNVSFGEACAN